MALPQRIILPFPSTETISFAYGDIASSMTIEKICSVLETYNIPFDGKLRHRSTSVPPTSYAILMCFAIAFKEVNTRFPIAKEFHIVYNISHNIVDDDEVEVVTPATIVEVLCEGTVHTASSSWSHSTEAWKSVSSSFIDQNQGACSSLVARSKKALSKACMLFESYKCKHKEVTTRLELSGPSTLHIPTRFSFKDISPPIFLITHHEEEIHVEELELVIPNDPMEGVEL
uniref:Uncharacterized protein n=1 Tax=Cannabis sativa TaxID=3483 RepID=A0A803P1X1_CANSA